MEFKYCSIGNKDYGGLDRDRSKYIDLERDIKTLNKR